MTRNAAVILTAALLPALTALAQAAESDEDGMVTATPARAIDAGPAENADAFSKAVGDYLKTVHGEVTAMVGTGGTYGVSATAVLPIGETGTLELSYAQGRSPGWWMGPGWVPHRR